MSGIDVNNYAAIGYSYDSKEGHCSGELNPSIPSGTEMLRVVSFDFEDAIFDRDSNGRFNQADIDDLIGSTDQDDLDLWDFDEDDEVEADEVVNLQAIVDAGFSSGVFADFDGDGDADCDDLIGVSSYFGYTIGQTNYQTVLDHDLNIVTTNSNETCN